MGHLPRVLRLVSKFPIIGTNKAGDIGPLRGNGGLMPDDANYVLLPLEPSFLEFLNLKLVRILLERNQQYRMVLMQLLSSKTKILLLHGELDTVVSPSNLLEAKDFLLRKRIEVQTNMIPNCEHHIPIKASSIALNYLKKNFSI